jgi:hypothetical protein
MPDPAPRLSPSTPAEDFEAAFRFNIEGVVETLEKLAPYFDSVEDLVESLKLALTNDGHMRFLTNKLIKQKRR